MIGREHATARDRVRLRAAHGRRRRVREIAKPPAHLLGNAWRPPTERGKRRSAAFDARSYERGFRFGLLAEYDDGDRPQPASFSRGHRAGFELVELIGPRTVEAALADAKRLQQRARELYAETEQACIKHQVAPPSPEPCSTCSSIGLCAASGRTCAVFRAYVSPPHGRGRHVERARVPDQSWAQSWREGPPDDIPKNVHFRESAVQRAQAFDALRAAQAKAARSCFRESSGAQR